MTRPSKTGVRGLMKKPNGLYCIDLVWVEPETGERRRYRETMAKGVKQATAKEHALAILNKAKRGGWDPKAGDPKRFSELVDEYEAWAKVNRPRTLRTRTSLSSVLSKVLGDCKLSEITPFLVERLKRERREKDKAEPGTINRAVAQLKHMLGLAATWGWVSRQVADDIRDMKMLREPPGRVRWLKPEEETALFAALPEQARRVTLAALLSGMRQGEVLALRKDTVDLQHREINLGVTKNGKRRVVPISDAFKVVLEEAMKKSPGDHVFGTRVARRPYTGDGFRSVFRLAVKDAGIEDLHFHDLRHDFSTKLRRRGVGLDVIAELLGHSSLKMAQRYTHIQADLLHEAVGKLPGPAVPPPPPAEQPAPAKKPTRRARGHKPGSRRTIPRPFPAIKAKRGAKAR